MDTQTEQGISPIAMPGFGFAFNLTLNNISSPLKLTSFYHLQTGREVDEKVTAAFLALLVSDVDDIVV